MMMIHDDDDGGGDPLTGIIWDPYIDTYDDDDDDYGQNYDSDIW